MFNRTSSFLGVIPLFIVCYFAFFWVLGGIFIFSQSLNRISAYNIYSLNHLYFVACFSFNLEFIER